MTVTPDIFRPQDPGSWDLNTDYEQSHSAIAGVTLADMANSDPRIAVLTADLKFSNRTYDFEVLHPKRFFNVGIAEQNMVSMAAGMAAVGYVPYVATFASFLGLLCIEQIRTDLAYPQMPVRLLAHHAGISMGFYGTSHHTTEDIGITRSIAGLTVIGPCDANSLDAALRNTVDFPGPIYFRLGRGRDKPVYERSDTRFQVGKLSVLRKGADIAIIANGVTVAESLLAAETLAQRGIDVMVVDAHTLRPFDVDGLCDIAATTKRILVAEEHNTYGGLGSICADALIDKGISGVKFTRVGTPVDDYALIAPPTHLYKHYGLDAAGIVNAVDTAMRS
ncbi:transketolase family protein [Microbacterium aurantiacum]|uniref:transketolase family protein n=1 Tax=Microbacterium aurantiacum TaxID=162393 RepID=UPI003D74D80B